MLSFAQKWLNEKGISYIACITGKENAAAQNMYQKSGFDTGDVIWVEKAFSKRFAALLPQLLLTGFFAM